MISYDLVVVRWSDIQSHDGPWVDMEEIPQYTPVTVETVGWIITDHEKYITVVSTLSDDQTFTGSVCSIPKGCIESVKVLCFDSKI
mgnify:CR=1 FL=1|tara:strand:+ start:533 stop:790 length:258 start_codon:yes stop_codon:yes gene_type:complete